MQINYKNYCQIASHLSHLPMDGYHIERKYLDENGMKYRGTHYTLDKEKLQKDLFNLKKKSKINFFLIFLLSLFLNRQFPSFDHFKKDLIFNDIQVNKTHKYV